MATRSKPFSSGCHGPVVAGTFYPGRADRLAETVRALLGGAGPSPVDGADAVIAPHAGLAYSGPVAASAFAAFEDARPKVDLVVILGPSHHHPFRGVALPDAESMAIPGARFAIDEEARGALLDADLVSIEPRAHALEHSVEVELPFVHARFGEVPILPLVVGAARPARVTRVLETVWHASTRVVVSSDLSHFLPDDAARRMDVQTAEAIEAFDADSISLDHACGAHVLAGFLPLAMRRGYRAHRLDLRNTFDVAGAAVGRDSVVGYGAWAFVASDSRDSAVTAP